MPSIDASLASLAATPVLLVATDFDGTLAPIVDDPDAAEATPRSRRALSTLARQYHTRVAVISGRGLADLAARLKPTEDTILMVGSHGSEFEPELAGRLTPEQAELRQQIHAAVEQAAKGCPGVLTEHKDASSSLHYRQASRADAAEALRRLRRAYRSMSQRPQIRRGKKVVELSVLVTHKGDAIARLRAEVGATGVLYIGDDRTDEDAFHGMGADDLSVKVGTGPTAADHRVAGPDEVSDLLARLADMRYRALRESTSVAITDLGFISNQRTGALITPEGEVTWYCPGRFDAPAMFASLLGGPTAGWFTVRPAGPPHRGHQRYLGDSLVLSTHWQTLHVVDYFSGDGQTAALVRRIVPAKPGSRCLIEFAPDLDFARLRTELVPENDKLRIVGGRESWVLEAPGVEFTVSQLGNSQVATAEVTLREPLDLVLRRTRGTDGRPGPEAVAEAWQQDIQSLLLPERWDNAVRRSVLVLRGLVYAPSGAMVAALTTSLPESIGYERNWDYRYCWLRDAALACDALLRVGSHKETRAFLSWLCDVVPSGDPSELQPLYGVNGEALLSEGALAHFIGYGGSQPVRVGNAAAEQLQIDVYGTIVELVATYVAFGHAITERLWRLVRQMVEAVAERWQEPDAGIWEQRHLYRHHVHSKVMCWVAVDRAIALAEQSGRPIPGDWPLLAEAIRDEVLEKGWHQSAGAFTVAYDSDDLDASVLYVLMSGMIEPDDPRAAATVDAIQSELLRGGTVRRYVYRDGFSGEEGGFHFCTSWLVECLVLLDRQQEAEALFTHVIGAAGATGILSEQVDPRTGAALGNVPQAYSHTGVIWNALSLTGSARARRPSPRRGVLRP